MQYNLLKINLLIFFWIFLTTGCGEEKKSDKIPGNKEINSVLEKKQQETSANKGLVEDKVVPEPQSPLKTPNDLRKEGPAGNPQYADIPVDIIISNKGYLKDKKGPVRFQHKKHNEVQKIPCKECHHDFDREGNNKWKDGDPVKKCIECHDPDKDQGKVKKLNSSYHGNCRECHKAVSEKGESKKAPFKECNGCHQKKG